MEPVRVLKSALIICPQCNELVAERHMKRHKTRVHNSKRIEREEVKARQRSLAAQLERSCIEKNRYLRTLVRCPTCEEAIEIGQIKSHFGNVHAAPAPENMLALLGEKLPQNQFRSGLERERYWRAVEHASEDQRSDDIFDRMKVVQAGAYGLGKSRKH